MALYVYRISDGVLISWGPGDDTPVATDEELAENGFAKVTGLAVIDETHAWDEATHTIVVVEARVRPRNIPTSRFVLAFTASELAAVRASSDPIVQQLWLAATVVPEIDMNRQTTIDGVGYLEATKLIASGRASVILETT